MKFMHNKQLHSIYKLKKRLVIKLLMIAAIVSQSVVFAATTISDSTSVNFAPASAKANTIFTKETGYLTSSTGSFTTSSACPANFQPFVTLTTGEVAAPGGGTGYNYASSDFKTCVTSISTGGSTVTVNYTRTSNYKNFYSYRYYSYDSGAYRYLTSSYSVDDNYGNDVYVSNEELYDLRTSTTLPRINKITGTTSNPSNIQKISWVLYCYPTGMTVPTASCT